MKSTNCGECSAFKIARDLTARKLAKDSFPSTFEDIEMATTDQTKTGVAQVLKICLEVLPREMFDKVMREFVGDAYEPFMGEDEEDETRPRSHAAWLDSINANSASDAALAAMEQKYNLPARRVRSVGLAPSEPLPLSPADRHAVDAFATSIGDMRSIRVL